MKIDKEDVLILLTLLGTVASVSIIFLSLKASHDSLNMLESLKDQDKQEWQRLLDLASQKKLPSQQQQQ